ncbi:ribosomal subunit 39S-domain-containing protein [Jackrogersella minutella]|nr:ribosomal subunit 39S-domain-containing protein [Jackrogersella minutella]
MRRIPRLRRPSGLSTSTSRHSPIAPLVGQCPSTSPPNISTSAPCRRPIPTSLQCPAFARLYSSEKQQPGRQTPVREVEEPRAEEEPKELVVQDAAYGEVVDEEPQHHWETFVPPPQRSYAERDDEVSDPSYVPAMTSEGLDKVGGLRDWWDREEHWSKDANFVGFKPKDKVAQPALIEIAVRRAVIEAFALRQAGREDDLVNAWPVSGEGDVRRVLEIGIDVADGAVVLTGDVSAVLDSFDPKNIPYNIEQSEASVEDPQKYTQAWGKDWKAVPLSDPRIKFAITKRIFQLTGHLVPDHQLASITNVKTLLHVVQKPPKPKTLTEEIQERRQDLVQLPNVSFATKRVTRGDTAKAFGRFKLVEEELKKRELPLEGHGFIRKNREMSRLKGGT